MPRSPRRLAPVLCPDALDVPLIDNVTSEELRLVGELMALANRCTGPRVPATQVDLILSTVPLPGRALADGPARRP